jgi:predicted transcriptional regulator
LELNNPNKYASYKAKVQKEYKAVGTRTIKNGHSLPKEVADVLSRLNLPQRKAYATLLRKAGWTLQSIATPLGITREAIRLYEKCQHSDTILAEVSELPIPELPKADVFKTVTTRKTTDPEVLARLKELQPKASAVRGKSVKYREEAEEYTRLIHETLMSGVSGYRLAKELGITHGAIAFRLVRYGYSTSKGESKSYKAIKHRKVKDNA